jgi:hypothetical protein
MGITGGGDRDGDKDGNGDGKGMGNGNGNGSGDEKRNRTCLLIILNVMCQILYVPRKRHGDIHTRRYRKSTLEKLNEETYQYKQLQGLL